MQTNFYDEIEVEMVPAEDRYPDMLGVPVEEADDALLYEMSPGEFEVARGVQLQSYGLDSYLPGGDEILLRNDNEQEDTEEKKIKTFLRALETDPAWVRSLHKVDLATSNSSFLREHLTQLLAHCIQNVNKRPKFMTVKTKNIGIEDIQDIVKLAFAREDNEMALNNSVFRLYCKNAASSLRKLTKHLITTCRDIPKLRVCYNDIFAEYKPSKSVSIRMKTRDFNSFLELEEHARNMLVNYQTTLSIKRRNDPSREIAINWYDRHVGGGHASFIHIDHSATRHTASRVSFSSVSCDEYEIPSGSEETPVCDAILALHRVKLHAKERAYENNSILKRFQQAGSILRENQLTLKRDQKVLPQHRENVKILAEELDAKNKKWKDPVTFEVPFVERKTPIEPTQNETKMNRTEFYTTCYEFPPSQTRKPRRSRSVGRVVSALKSPSRAKSAIRTKLDFDL